MRRIFPVFSLSFSRKTIATVLAIIMYGVGHIYLGAARRGIAILFVGLGLLLMGHPGFLTLEYAAGDEMQFTTAMIMVFVLMAAGLTSFGFWIWQIFDARKVAKQQTIEA
jgi:hypothetical protein